MSAPIVPPLPSAGLALVADDDRLIRAQLGDLLRARGHQVLEASTGEEAAAAALASLDELQVVLLDLTMPDKDGFDVLTEIREPTRARGIPIVVLTGGTAEQAQCAVALGADEAFIKGASPEELGALLDVVLARGHVTEGAG